MYCKCNPVQLLCCGTSHREIPTSHRLSNKEFCYIVLTAAGVNDTVPRHVSRTDRAVSYWNSTVLHLLSLYIFFSFRLKFVRLLTRLMMFHEYGRCETKRMWPVLKFCSSMEWLRKTQNKLFSTSCFRVRIRTCNQRNTDEERKLLQHWKQLVSLKHAGLRIAAFI